MKKPTFITLALWVSILSLSAQIINVPADQSSIQAGINVANNGDTVLVAQGTYYENINFKGKAITVASHFILPESQAPLTEGLVAHWLFNGNGNDVSGNGHHGVASAGHPNWGAGMPELAEDRHGNMNYCYKIVDGGNFVVPNDPAFLPEELTISVWMKLYESWPHSYFISNDIWHSWKFQVQSANKPFFTAHYIKDDGSGEEAWIDKDSNMESLDMDTWQHIVLTYTSGKMVFYIDGENVMEWDDFPTGTLIEPHPGIDLCIGQALPAEAYTDIEGDPHQWKEWLGYLKGYLDDMRFYNIILTDEEVGDLYEYERDNTIEATDYITTTIIDGGQPNNPDSASVVYFISGEDENSVLKGFTLTNGEGTFIPQEDATSGGGILCTGTSPTLSNLIIDGNQSYLASGIFCEFSNLKVVNTVISNNGYFCEVGGGMICLSSNPIFQNVVFDNNQADFGGGIYLEETDGNFINVQFTNNDGGYGGAMLCLTESNPMIANATFADNVAIYGGAIACFEDSNPELTNTILFYNNPDQIYFTEDGGANSVTISYSNIEGGESGIVTNGNGWVNWLDGNIEQDPDFSNNESFPYSLQNTSHSVNTGNPDTNGLHLPESDLAGGSRFYGGRIDMGAYENQDIYVGTEVEDHQLSMPDISVYPNPFRSTTNIKFDIPNTNVAVITIYNHLGELVDEINVDNYQGEHLIEWNETDLPPGIYFCVLRAGHLVQTTKMVKM